MSTAMNKPYDSNDELLKKMLGNLVSPTFVKMQALSKIDGDNANELKQELGKMMCRTPLSTLKKAMPNAFSVSSHNMPSDLGSILIQFISNDSSTC